MTFSTVDPYTHGCIRPEHVRYDIRLIDRQIAQIKAREATAGVDVAAALRLLHEARAARMRQLRAMVLEE